MITKLPNITLNLDDTWKMQVAEWAWNSHWWVEEHPGYYNCKWCKKTSTSSSGIFYEYPLCKENPRLK